MTPVFQYRGKAYHYRPDLPAADKAEIDRDLKDYQWACEDQWCSAFGEPVEVGRYKKNKVLERILAAIDHGDLITKQALFDLLGITQLCVGREV